MQRHEPLATDRSRSDRAAYLRERLRPTPLVVLLLLAMAYPFAAGETQATVFVALCALAGLLIARAPRWACYAAMSVVLLVLVWEYVFIISTGPQDSQSDRDEAVEIAAQGFLAGANPWAHPTQLKTPISTGPASVLIALPSVLATRQINAASFLFYILFFAMLCAADLSYRNDTFLALGLLFTSGFLGFQHALYWSLDELVWAYLVLALGWWLLETGSAMSAGACLAFALCSRVSYGFPVFAFLCWYWFSPRPRHVLVRVAAGAVLGTVLIVAPFLVIGGRDLLTHNPFFVAGNKSTAQWPSTNPIFRALNASLGSIGPGPDAVIKTVLALAAIWYGSRRLGSSGPAHPFWHMCFAALAADFLVYPAVLSDDYTLFFAVPAFMAIALTPHGLGAAASDAVSIGAAAAPRRRGRR